MSIFNQSLAFRLLSSAEVAAADRPLTGEEKMTPHPPGKFHSSKIKPITENLPFSAAQSTFQKKLFFFFNQSCILILDRRLNALSKVKVQQYISKLHWNYVSGEVKNSRH